MDWGSHVTSSVVLHDYIHDLNFFVGLNFHFIEFDTSLGILDSGGPQFVVGIRFIQ